MQFGVLFKICCKPCFDPPTELYQEPQQRELHASKCHLALQAPSRNPKSHNIPLCQALRAKCPNSRVSGSKNHSEYGFWDLKPYYLGTRTLWEVSGGGSNISAPVHGPSHTCFHLPKILLHPLPRTHTLNSKP